MKYLIVILFAAFGLNNQSTLMAQESETFDVKVIITNVNSQKGVVRLGIFDNSKTFLDKGKEYKTFNKKPSGDTVVFHIKDMKTGDYAFSLYHDINSDDKCNLNFLLRPSEPYGFSNNVKLKLFKPNYEDCKIMVDKDKTITIELIE